MADYEGACLEQRVIHDIDYIIHDNAVSQLLSVIECPIPRDTSDDNVVFNYQYYDKKAWIQHVRQEQWRNRNDELQ